MQNGIKGIIFREWIGNATAMSLVGDFNDWDATAHPAHQLEHDVYEVWLPDKGEERAIPHLSKVKVLLTLKDGKQVYRVPTHIHYAIPDPINPSSYVGVYWDFETHDYEYTIPTRQSPLLLNHSGLRCKIHSFHHMQHLRVSHWNVWRRAYRIHLHLLSPLRPPTYCSWRLQLRGHKDRV